MSSWSREKPSARTPEYLTVVGGSKNDVHVVRSNNFRLRYYQRLNIVRPQSFRTHLDRPSVLLEPSRKVSISPERTKSSLNESPAFRYCEWEAKAAQDLAELEPIFRTKSLLEGETFEMEV